MIFEIIAVNRSLFCPFKITFICVVLVKKDKEPPFRAQQIQLMTTSEYAIIVLCLLELVGCETEIESYQLFMDYYKSNVG